MSFFKTILAALVLGLLAVPAQAQNALTDAQKAEVEAVVRELLVKKEPEIVVRAAEAVQSKMEKEAAEKGLEAIGKNKDKLLNDPDSPVAGNPKGDVTVVVFFDYSCGYCKMAQSHVERLLAEDKNVRLVYKEFPILGPGSLKAAEAALASIPQGRYAAFHNALMESKKKLGEEDIYEIAGKVGLNVEKLKKDMKGEKIQKMIDANRALADTLGIHGTPSFIIGDKLYPGALPLDQMKKVIEAIRETKKK